MTLLTAEENKIKFKSIKGKEPEYECYKTLKSFWIQVLMDLDPNLESDS